MSKIDGDSVGKFFTTNGADCWRCVSFCSEPTAKFENVETKEVCGGAVQSRNVAQFKALLPES